MALRGKAGVVVAILAALWLTGGQAAAQAPAAKPEAVVGTWEGISKGTNGEVPVRLDVQYAGGKFTGTIGTPGMVIAILDGTLEGDTLTLTLDVQGMSGTMTGKVDGARLEATWTVASETGAVILVKSAAGGPAAAAAASPAGEWSGEAMVQGQPMPITLVLTVNGESVTGEMQSAMGRVPLTSGSWKDGTLSLAFPYSGGEPVTMNGTILEGKLGGVFDYNSGEAQGTWWAAKK